MKLSLRRRILTFVAIMVLISLMSSLVSVYQITGVGKSLESINTLMIPLGRKLTQLHADSQILRRELESRLAYSHWQEPHWTPRPMPQWLSELMSESIEKIQGLIPPANFLTTDPQSTLQKTWLLWTQQAQKDFLQLSKLSDQLFHLLESDQQSAALGIYSQWIAAIEKFLKHLKTGVKSSDLDLAANFEKLDQQTRQLRLGLELMLVVVFLLSLLLLWFGERALRPLADLSALLRKITQNGLRKEHKAMLHQLPIARDDEVGRLAREFHLMATMLLERELSLDEEQRHVRDLQKIERQLEKRLRQAENMAAMGRLSAQVAHEIRNPLHSIGLEAEMALDMAQQHKDCDLKQAISSIMESVDRLEKITENYLKLSRLSSGQRVAIDLAEVLQNVLATYSSICEAEKVKVDWMIEAGSQTRVSVDRELLEQVLGNLLKNSLQALESGRMHEQKPSLQGLIRWSLGSLETGKVWLRIRDNGPGVPAEIRDQLFQPFVTSRAQGTGLGLSFVKKVMQDHGGDVRWMETEEGQTCFELIFPPLAEAELNWNDSEKRSEQLPVHLAGSP